MPFTYTNRKGFTYYLCQSTTKTGKTRYYFAREPKDTPVKRFILEEPEERIFSPQRWCFRGSIDDWIYINGPAKIEKLVKELVPALGTGEFSSFSKLDFVHSKVQKGICRARIAVRRTNPGWFLDVIRKD